jgi:hypothetical protein
LAHSFRSFSLWLVGSAAFCPVVRVYHDASTWQEKVLTSWREKAKYKKGRSQSPTSPSRALN